MNWNKRENFGQTVRNYENNVSIPYFVLLDYFYIIVIILHYSI